MAANEPAGLYVHVPFCERACPYCDFDFEVGARRAQVWLDGLARECDARAQELARPIDTLYLGGGTPSSLTLAQTRALWALLRARTPQLELRECTVELNPEHATDERLDVLVELGVDRVSLGVQSGRADGLRSLGRAHAPADAHAAVRACVARGLRTSVDLIVGWPGHDRAMLDDELAQIVDAGAEHLSIYALTIEPDTPWPKLVRRGLRVLPDEDVQAELLLAAEAELQRRGFVHYEVASYARPGAEAIHNGKYWRFVDVIGLGPSAASVGHVAGAVERRSNPRGLDAWLAGPPEHERLVAEQAAAEGLWLGLRRLAGLELDAYLARFAVDRAWVEARVARQVELGNLRWSSDRSRIAVAPDRWLWHDTIAVDLL